MRRRRKRSVKPSRAGIFRVTAWESELGFCVKAVRKPAGYCKLRPVLESPPGARPAGRNIRTIADWSSSQNNNNNAWAQHFGDGRQNNNNKNNTNAVRAVRGFTQRRQGEGSAPSSGSVLELYIPKQDPFFKEFERHAA